jgi:UPF0755 protein
MLATGYLLFIIAIPAQFWDNAFPPGSGPEIRAIIEPGRSAREVAISFQEQGIVDDAASLSRWMVHLGIDRHLKPGTYTIRKGTPWETARQLIGKDPEYFRFTIIPGSEVSALTEIFPSFSSEDIYASLADETNYPKDLRPVLPENMEGRIAFLMPETYHISLAHPDYAVRQASASWLDKIGKEIDFSSISAEEIHSKAIIASLIEKESGIDRERPLIAGVIYNRLNRGMPLQIDATVIYAWKKKGRILKRVLYEDLEVSSPYNTYKTKGLPPEPICVPSLASWKASIKPQKSEYLYYVANGSGEHVFSRNYQEHLKSIKKIRKGK